MPPSYFLPGASCPPWEERMSENASFFFYSPWLFLKLLTTFMIISQNLSYFEMTLFGCVALESDHCQNDGQIVT